MQCTGDDREDSHGKGQQKAFIAWRFLVAETAWFLGSRRVEGSQQFAWAWVGFEGALAAFIVGSKGLVFAIQRFEAAEEAVLGHHTRRRQCATFGEAEASS